MPPVPQPDLHPGVVVVAVGPAGDVDLPGGNAKGPQSVYGEDGFLPTAPTAGPVYRQGGGSAQIGGLIGRLLRAPVVDLNGRPLRGEPRGPLRQQAVKQPPAVAEFLLIDPAVEHIGQENFLRYTPSQGRALPQECPVGRAGEEKAEVIVCHIAEGAVGVQPPQRVHHILGVVLGGGLRSGQDLLSTPPGSLRPVQEAPAGRSRCVRPEHHSVCTS